MGWVADLPSPTKTLAYRPGRARAGCAGQRKRNHPGIAERGMPRLGQEPRRQLCSRAPHLAGHRLSRFVSAAEPWKVAPRRRRQRGLCRPLAGGAGLRGAGRSLGAGAWGGLDGSPAGLEAASLRRASSPGSDESLIWGRLWSTRRPAASAGLGVARGFWGRGPGGALQAALRYRSPAVRAVAAPASGWMLGAGLPGLRPPRRSGSQFPDLQNKRLWRVEASAGPGSQGWEGAPPRRLAAGAEVLSTEAVGRPPLLSRCLLRLPTRETEAGWDSTREGPRGRRLSTLPPLGRGLAAPSRRVRCAALEIWQPGPDSQHDCGAQGASSTLWRLRGSSAREAEATPCGVLRGFVITHKLDLRVLKVKLPVNVCRRETSSFLAQG